MCNEITRGNWIVGGKFSIDRIWREVRRLLHYHDIIISGGIETLDKPFGILGYHKKLLMSSEFLKMCKKNGVETWLAMKNLTDKSSFDYAKFCFMKGKFKSKDNNALHTVYICWTYTQHPDGYFSLVVADDNELEDVSDDMNVYLKCARISNAIANVCFIGIICLPLLLISSIIGCSIEKMNHHQIIDRYEKMTSLTIK